MVLPTDYHWALRGWMRTHRVVAHEVGGSLVIKNLNGLLRLAGSPRRLTPDERAAVKVARARARTVPKAPALYGHLPDSVLADTKELIEALRSDRRDAPDIELMQMASMHPRVREALNDHDGAWRRDPLGARLHALLDDVCAALGEVGVAAAPALGLGLIRGDEILDVRVEIVDTGHLYDLMRAEGFSARPDWDAEPFREKSWEKPTTTAGL